MFCTVVGLPLVQHRHPQNDFAAHLLANIWGQSSVWLICALVNKLSGLATHYLDVVSGGQG